MNRHESRCPHVRPYQKHHQDQAWKLRALVLLHAISSLSSFLCYRVGDLKQSDVKIIVRTDCRNRSYKAVIFNQPAQELGRKAISSDPAFRRTALLAYQSSSSRFREENR